MIYKHKQGKMINGQVQQFMIKMELMMEPRMDKAAAMDTVMLTSFIVSLWLWEDGCRYEIAI